MPKRKGGENVPSVVKVGWDDGWAEGEEGEVEGVDSLNDGSKAADE